MIKQEEQVSHGKLLNSAKNELLKQEDSGENEIHEEEKSLNDAQLHL